MSKVIRVEETLMSSEDITNIITTFQVSENVGVVLVPLNLFIATPSTICGAFKTMNRQIIQKTDVVNVFVESDIIFPSDFGRLDQLTHTWTLTGSNEEFLNTVIETLGTKTTMLSLTLNHHKVFSKDSQVEYLAFIKPCSDCMKSFLDKLCNIRDNIHSNGNKKFAIELNLSYAVERWARAVLGEDMTCIGGKLGVTSGDLFNPLFKWNVTMGCLPCLPFSVLAGLAYRAKRKVQYIEEKIKAQDTICILGSNSLDIQDQRESLSSMTRIAVTLSVEKGRRYSRKSLDIRRRSDDLPSQQQTTSFIMNEQQEPVSPVDRKIIDFNRFTSLDEAPHSSNGATGPRQSISHIEFEIVNDKHSQQVEW